MSQKRRTTSAEPVCAALCVLYLHVSLMYSGMKQQSISVLFIQQKNNDSSAV